MLVHGAFTDASSWHGVIGNLQRAGYPVVAPPNPLRDRAADSAYVAGIVRNINGPVIMVGHSYGGAVITNAARETPNVTGLDPTKFHHVFAQDIPAKQAAVTATTQRPIAAATFDSPSGVPAWKQLPSWFLVATDDHALHPAAQTDMAKRAHAEQTLKISGGHALPVSHPDDVTRLIRTAACRTHHR